MISPSNKIHRKVGRSKDLSAPLYTVKIVYICIFMTCCTSCCIFDTLIDSWKVLVYLFTYLCMYVCIFVSTYLCIYICMNVFMYVIRCVCMCHQTGPIYEIKRMLFPASFVPFHKNYVLLHINN